MPASVGKWAAKLASSKPPQIKVLGKRFADLPEGCRMLIPSPALIDQRIREIPRGKTLTTRALRRELSLAHDADGTCPVTTGIFLRVVAEAALEAHPEGDDAMTPFWRVIEPDSPLAAKLSCGAEFIGLRREAESPS